MSPQWFANSIPASTLLLSLIFPAGDTIMMVSPFFKCGGRIKSRAIDVA